MAQAIRIRTQGQGKSATKQQKGGNKKPTKGIRYSSWHLIFEGIEVDGKTLQRLREEIPWTEATDDGRLVFHSAETEECKAVHQKIQEIVSGSPKPVESKTYSLIMESQ
jgi:hypothetical protein